MKMSQTAGKIRLWFAGEGRLVEMPDLRLEEAPMGSPSGVGSYYDLSFDFLGCPNDMTIGVLEALALTERYRGASLKFFVAHELNDQLVCRRYRKGNLVLTRLDRWSAIWGYNPIELMAEAAKLEKGVGDGWEPDEVIVESEMPEGSSVFGASIATNIYILKEKAVVDLMAVVGQQIGARLYLVGAICAIAGFALGHLLH